MSEQTKSWGNDLDEKGEKSCKKMTNKRNIVKEIGNKVVVQVIEKKKEQLIMKYSR